MNSLKLKQQLFSKRRLDWIIFFIPILKTFLFLIALTINVYTLLFDDGPSKTNEYGEVYQKRSKIYESLLTFLLFILVLCNVVAFTLIITEKCFLAVIMKLDMEIESEAIEKELEDYDDHHTLVDKNKTWFKKIRLRMIYR